MNNVLQFFLQGVAGQGHQVFGLLWFYTFYTIWWRIFWEYFNLTSTEVNNWVVVDKIILPRAWHFIFTFQGVGMPGQPLHNPAVAKLLWWSMINEVPSSPRKLLSTIFNYLNRWKQYKIRSAALTKILYICQVAVSLYLMSSCLEWL